eukprot:12905246-Prorocentrum_lima.AAC.1
MDSTMNGLLTPSENCGTDIPHASSPCCFVLPGNHQSIPGCRTKRDVADLTVCGVPGVERT